MSQKHIPEEMIVDYVLGNLSSEDHFFVMSHLNRCKKCTLEQAAWRKFLLNETVSVVTPSSSLKDKVSQTITRWRAKKTSKHVIAMASIFVFSLIGVFLFQLSNQQLMVEEDQSMKYSPIVTHEQRSWMNSNHMLSLPLQQTANEGIAQINASYEHVYPSFMNLNNNQQTNHAHKQVIMLQDELVCLLDKQTFELTCYKLLSKNSGW